MTIVKVVNNIKGGCTGKTLALYQGMSSGLCKEAFVARTEPSVIDGQSL